MPQTNFAVDVLGVLTISLAALLLLFGLFCIIYTLYFSIRVRRSGFPSQLRYFNGPWIVRITFIVFAICWGAGEVVRLSFFRQDGRVFHSLDRKWQENMCKLYILSNLGFTEPCLFLTMSFLLHASLKWRGILNPKWNIKTIAYVLLYCLPVFVLDFLFVIVAPRLKHGKKIHALRRLPQNFTSTFLSLTVSGRHVIACTYPVLCTMLHGLFSVILTAYLLLLGRQMVVSVINKKLQRRVYVLIFLVSSFLPLRVLLLGFSVFARQEHLLFEILVFFGFCVLLSCVVVGIVLLVLLPVWDSLALNQGCLGLERRSSITSADDEYAESLSLIAPNQRHHLEGRSTPPSHGRNSDASTKRGSVSFRSMVKNEASSTGAIDEEEVATFSPGFRLLSEFSPGSPGMVSPSSKF